MKKIDPLLIQMINKDCLPRHIAIIMDGNGRWAQQNNKPRVFGHRNGVKAVRAASEAAAEIGIEYLTLYAFSRENWHRPPTEVNALMTLLVHTLRNEVKTLNKNDIRLNAIGETDKLPAKCYRELCEAMEATSGNKRMVLTLALNYGSRWEITSAARKIAAMVAAGQLNPNEITEDLLANLLETAALPDPELVIRTSGEFRISNFLLWQIAYAELTFIPKFWPEFSKEDLCNAIIDYQNRERRFGKTSDQILDENRI